MELLGDDQSETRTGSADSILAPDWLMTRWQVLALESAAWRPPSSLPPASSPSSWDENILKYLILIFWNISTSIPSTPGLDLRGEIALNGRDGGLLLVAAQTVVVVGAVDWSGGLVLIVVVGGLRRKYFVIFFEYFAIFFEYSVIFFVYLEIFFEYLDFFLNIWIFLWIFGYIWEIFLKYFYLGDGRGDWGRVAVLSSGSSVLSLVGGSGQSFPDIKQIIISDCNKMSGSQCCDARSLMP